MSVPSALVVSNGACLGRLATWRRLGLLEISSTARPGAAGVTPSVAVAGAALLAGLVATPATSRPAATTLTIFNCRGRGRGNLIIGGTLRKGTMRVRHLTGQ